MRSRVRLPVAGLVLALTITAACSSRATGSSSSSMTLYTCATDTIEQAVVAAFEKQHGGTVHVFRAPTGQLNARVAGDSRSGGIRADVIWACDPLTMYGFQSQGLIAAWTPPTSQSGIGAAYRTDHFVGIALLYLVAVVHKGTPPPTTWADLAGAKYRNAVAIPSPTFAASALGMLGYFASAPDYGLPFYQRLKSNGAKQVDSPDEVLSGVAQGTYRAGIALANAAYAAQKKGSPIQVVWPRPGAITVYGPIGVTTRKNLSPLAHAFVTFAASRAGQTILGQHGAYPAAAGVPGPKMPAGSPVVAPPWPQLAGQSKDLLRRYAAIFPS